MSTVGYPYLTIDKYYYVLPSLLTLNYKSQEELFWQLKSLAKQFLFMPLNT